MLCFEFLKMGLIIGDLPNTVRSPDAAVKNDNGVFACQIGRDLHSPAIYERHREVWKIVAWIELFGHLPALLLVTLNAEPSDCVALEPFNQ